jgi:carboxyl-terminal processing protease
LIITCLAIIFFSNTLTVNALDKTLEPDPEKDKVLVYVLKNILTRGHFVVKEINDDFSELVYKGFIEGLDPSKRYFTQEDLKEFSKYKYQIDNQLLEDDVSFYNLVYDRFLDKVQNAKSYYGDLLAQPFKFKKNEFIDIDYDQVPFAKK